VKEKMADLNKKLQEIATQLEALTVVEMSELASYLEDKFGVSAMPMMGAAAAPVAAAGEPAEEKTSFTVVLEVAGEKKLEVIKAVRELNQSLGLMEAKTLVESAPKDILVDAKKDAAEEAKKKLEAAGAKVSLK
jgi:large subunit ribosomal protein L7/L12